jgi:hypothetical protein
VHTDEPELNWNELRDALTGVTIAGLAQVTEAYVIFSHDPTVGHCPVVSVNVGP